MPEPHQIQMEVRDYECDLSGIVNNAVYQHYLEHARHHALRCLGVDYAVLASQGVHLVVLRIEIDYLHPLRSSDVFTVSTSLGRTSPLRFFFDQRITRLPDGKQVLKARVTGTAIDDRGRPSLPVEYRTLFYQIFPLDTSA